MPLFLRVSITKKFILLSLLISATAWGMLDCFQSRMIEKIFKRHIDSDLQISAREDRELFDTYLASFRQSVRLLITNRKLTEHLLSSEWDNRKNSAVIKYNIPKWLPNKAVLRAMPLVDYFLLLDRDGRVGEVFSGYKESVPQQLQALQPLLYKLSHNQTLLTKIGREAFAVTSDIVLDDNDFVLGYLMLVSQLDSDFIYASVQGMNRHNLIALVDNQTGRVIADNNPNITLTGIDENKLTQQYHILGKSFFDYGASDLDAHFLSLMPKEHYQEMGREILTATRWSRAMTGTVILTCLSFVLFTVTRRIGKVTSRIDEFAEKELQTSIISGRTGDQLLVLEDRFLALGQQMIETRNNLQEQVAQRTKEYQKTNCLLEAEIKERINGEKQLKAMLVEKEVLLKEIHHRVKNNMQIAASLMFLQSRTVANPEALQVLQDSQERIKSMGLVHELLYQSGNFSRVPFNEYIKSLAQSLRGSYGEGERQNISVHVETEDIPLTVEKAIPCGLIINELITNSFKYAFPDNKPGNITVQFTMKNNLYVLMVRDNGIGLPADYNWKAAESLGLHLVRTLAGQLDAEIRFKNDNGLKIDLIFKGPHP